MRTSIAINFRQDGTAEVTNRSQESIKLGMPGGKRSVKVAPFSKYTGNGRWSSHTSLPAVQAARGTAPYPTEVRRAGPDDLDGLLGFVPPLLAESALLPLSLSKVERLISRCATREGGAIAGIIDGPNGIEASIGLAVYDSDVSDERYFRAVWCGLGQGVRESPEYGEDPRRHRGRTLLDFAKWCHAELERAAGRPLLLQLDVATRPALESKLAWYHRHAVQVGAIFALGSFGDFLPLGDLGQSEPAAA